jgi:hypothetical protein
MGSWNLGTRLKSNAPELLVVQFQRVARLLNAPVHCFRVWTKQTDRQHRINSQMHTTSFSEQNVLRSTEGLGHAPHRRRLRRPGDFRRWEKERQNGR